MALFIFTFIFSNICISQQLKLSEIKKAFNEKSLEKYIRSGQSIVTYYETLFKQVSNPSVLDAGFAAEYFDLEYHANLRPNIQEPYLSLNELTQDTNNLLKLHRKYYSKIKNKVFLRNYFQTAFLGLVHTIESIKKVQVGLPQDGYNVLTNLVLEHGRLITSDQKTLVTMTDFWWDFMWAFFTNYPIDLVELGNQKLRGVWINESKEIYKKQIEKFLAAYSLLALRKATSPLIYRDITNQLLVRLAKNAYEIYKLREDENALSKARIFKYKYETRTGLTEEAEKTKREIAREGLFVRVKKMYSEPVNRLAEKDFNYFKRFFNFVISFLTSLYSFIRYLIGFLLITFPFDGALILAGVIILSIEGRVQFEKEFIQLENSRFQKKNKLKYLKIFIEKVKSSIARIVNDLVFSLQMLLHSYTQDLTTRNVRIGSSLLIFGLGLFFSSARTMVEAFVAQMSL